MEFSCYVRTAKELNTASFLTNTSAVKANPEAAVSMFGIR